MENIFTEKLHSLLFDDLNDNIDWLKKKSIACTLHINTSSSKNYGKKRDLDVKPSIYE